MRLVKIKIDVCFQIRRQCMLSVMKKLELPKIFGELYCARHAFLNVIISIDENFRSFVFMEKKSMIYKLTKVEE